ncbi:hypothetical protein AAP_00661 [Ascosphaera apis ARSEF 7405]|uniref:Uncharacterized protein n=1 Tax=Ascosphaera apis ARSEF 7405 TaxID=392613 RepID=A0A168CU81_9EURO|nr:hypothetical protein AAP_00661 [Ascosphaera apis ARSEF 7405]
MSTQTGPSVIPPTTILSSEEISQSAAHDFLAAYLDRAATDPSLQPDSTLSGHGPVSAHSGAAPNLIIHNLRRVQAGLAGEVLGQDPVFAKLEAGEFDISSNNFGPDDAKKAEQGVEWQDLQTFEREQEVIDVAGGDEEEAQNGIDIGDPDVMDTEIDAAKLAKEQRKKDKMERRKAEQRARSQG